MIKLADGDVLSLLPAHIAQDPAFAATGTAIAPFLQELAHAIPNLLVFARLGGQQPANMLPPLRRLTEARGGLKKPETALLESLAWQFHVDFREVAETDDQLAALVRNAIPWHRIKGTPASIRAALELCGYSGITIEEDGEGDFWAAYQLGLSGVTGMDDLARIVTICREMQPARCRLWRVYTPEYDFRPGVWSGPLPVCSWSQCWWSAYSGAEAPDIPGLDDDTGLIVSFGSRRGVLVTPLCGEQGRAALLITLDHGWQARYRDFPAWSECAYGDVFPRDHSFTFAHFYSFTWAAPEYARHCWNGPWDNRAWRGRLLRVDRQLPPWRFHIHSHPLTEAVWSGCEPGYTPTFRPDAAHGRVLSDVPGTWSALNFWGHAPRLETLPEPQVWSADAWSGHALTPEATEVPECVPCLRGAAVEPARPPRPRRTITAGHAAAARPLYNLRWRGAWDDRRWRGHCGFFTFTTEVLP